MVLGLLKSCPEREGRRHELSKESFEQKKWVSYLYRTATTVYPCYLPVLGEFNRSWSYKTYPAQR